MRMLLRRLLLIAMLLAAVVAQAGPVMVFAAASLTDSLQEIAQTYTRQTGEKIILNFGASSTLARQIIEGAPADVFFSADESKMDSLAQQNLIAPETRRDLLSNSLVIIVPFDSHLAIASARDLAAPTVKHFALADPKSVPAGVYARQYLEKLGLWAALEPKVIPVENVRAALAAVESGNVEAGMVYATDAAISKKVRVAFLVPLNEGPVIVYPIAMVKNSSDPVAAKKFLDYLHSFASSGVFEKFHFIVSHERQDIAK